MPLKVLVVFSILFLTACGTTAEIPEPAPAPVAAKKTKKIGRYLASQTSIRALETDCLIFSQPNLYSQQTDTARAGNSVWTEETDSSWYKVYKNNRFGYMSKICFNN